jgi:hypothetical protein
VRERLMGVETEYAISAVSRKGKSLNRHILVQTLLRVAREQMPHIRDFGNGMFLQNGSRFYVDSGLHPEFATPECANPLEAVIHVAAGEAILRKIIDALENRFPEISEIQLFRTNVDYGGTESSWGCHESYLTWMNPSAISAGIIPHLVSRVIYTGAGGFNPLSEGLAFSLSPRVAHLERIISDESTRGRGIFHAKNETLAREGSNRLHILCGESLCSQVSSFIKIGATSLVVAMIEADACPTEGVQLKFPLSAMRAFSADPECAAAAALKNGKSATAIEIQRHYLRQAETSLGRSFMPDWAESVCAEWRRILDQLERDPGALDTTLDWAVKHSMFRDQARRRGMAWESLPHWNRVMNWLRGALTATEFHAMPVTAELVLGPDSPLKNEVKIITPYLADMGLNWGDFARFMDLRRELFEIDMRFSQLGSKGIFAALDRAGVLSHRRFTTREIRSAMAHPPSFGRAKLRGEFVRRNAGRGGRIHCDWRGIWDSRSKRVLDLSDPFAAEEKWRDFTKEEAGWSRDPGLPELRRLNRVRIILESDLFQAVDPAIIPPNDVPF